MARRFSLRRRRRQKATTPDGLPVVSFPPGYIENLTLYGLRGSYGWLYRTQPNVRSVVDFLASEVASVNLKHYEKVPTSSSRPSGRIELEQSDLQRLLNRPSPNVTRSRLWFATVADMCIYDVAYWFKVRRGLAIEALVRIPPAALRAQREPFTQQILYYNSSLGGRIDPTDLVVFYGYDPELTEGAVPPLETLRRVLAEEWAAGRNREFTWKNAARKDGVVERPVDAPPWDEDQREAWRLEWEGVMSGDTNAARTALLEDGMTWKESTWSPREMEYLAARKLTRQECAAAYRVDPRLTFASDDRVIPDTRTGFYTDRLVPLLTRLQEEIDLQLLPEFDLFDAEQRQYTEFNIGEKMRGSFIDEAKIASSVVGGPTVMVNEWRARWNLPPVPGGDDIYVPLNSVRAGGPQASPQAPVQTPGDQPAGITPGGGTAPGAAPGFPRERPQVTASLEPLGATERLVAALIQPGNGNGHATVTQAVKVPRRVLARREVTVSAYRRVLSKHLARQKRSLTAGGRADSERWNNELAQNLVTVSRVVVDDNAKRAAQQINASKAASYDPARTRNYIDTVTGIQAQRINAKTAQDLEDAGDDPEAIAAVFADEAGTATSGRLDALGETFATLFINFGRQEGASQAGGKSKTWVVTSANSRHPELDGEQAPLGEAFSNGLSFPGEFSADPAESAGCTCLMNLE